MTEDLLAFFERSARPARDLHADLRQWADLAATRAVDLEACRPGAHGLLVDCALELRDAIAAGALPRDGGAQRVADLCAYLHASASAMHEDVIPAYETEAHTAAWDVDRAALEILSALKPELGARHTY